MNDILQTSSTPISNHFIVEIISLREQLATAQLCIEQMRIALSALASTWATVCNSQGWEPSHMVAYKMAQDCLGYTQYIDALRKHDVDLLRKVIDKLNSMLSDGKVSAIEVCIAIPIILNMADDIEAGKDAL